MHDDRLGLINTKKLILIKMNLKLMFLPVTAHNYDELKTNFYTFRKNNKKRYHWG